MKTLRLTLLYVFAALIVIILGGLVGWYFFLHVPQANTDAVDAARGLGSGATSFTGGSTEQNISAVVGGGSFDASATSSSPLWEVDSTPVAGMGFVTSTTTIDLEYVERANGYVFSADPGPRSSVRLTDTLFPKIYEALVAINGSVIERSLDNTGSITTFMGTLDATTSSTSTSTTQNVLGGAYGPENIQAITLNPTASSIFYTVPNSLGGVDGMTAQWNGSKQQKVFSSTIAHWTPLWLSDGRLVITENPADNLPGYSYIVANDGTMTLLVGNVPGLTVLPLAFARALIYGSSVNNQLTLFAQSAASSTGSALAIQTIADKCVWLPSKSAIAYCAVPITAPTGDFLDAWYQGAVHTSDAWWEVDVAMGSTTMIYSPKSSAGVDIDVEHPMIDSSGNYIAFINASDQSLWMLKIPQ